MSVIVSQNVTITNKKKYQQL